jgi:hypothetical protein
MTRTFAHQQRRNPMAVECMFTCYWLADLWTQEGIPVVLVLPRPLRHAFSCPSLSEQTTLEGASSSSLHSRGVNCGQGRHQLQVAGNRLSGVSATGWP